MIKRNKKTQLDVSKKKENSVGTWKVNHKEKNTLRIKFEVFM